MTIAHRSNFTPKALLEQGETSHEDLPPAFHIMLKPRGPICNLDCTYCFYLRKEQLYGKSTSFYMPDDVLEEFTRQYIEAQKVPEVTFGWQGGEPTLMGLGLLPQSRCLAGEISQAQHAHQKHIPDQRRSVGRRVVSLLQGAQLFDRAEHGRTEGTARCLSG